MRIRIAHEIVHAYLKPAAHVVQTLRLTPRSHEAQFVANWRIDIDADCRLDPVDDPYGNITHTFTVDGPVTRLAILVEGEVETEPAMGFVRGSADRLPLGFHLRETTLTVPDGAVRAFAEGHAAADAGDRLTALHALQSHLAKEFAWDGGPATVAPTAAEVLAARRGTSRDLAHLFVASARALGVPARVVKGYLLAEPPLRCSAAGHVWAEAHVASYGWIGFDPVNDTCVTERHVRIAIGADAVEAAPFRGVQIGGEGEVVSVSVTVEPAVFVRKPLPKRR